MTKLIPTPVDSTGWHAKQYNAAIPPAHPSTDDRERSAETKVAPINTVSEHVQAPRARRLTAFGWC